MMTAANVLEVSNWITELKLLMLTLHEYETTNASTIVLATRQSTRVIIPWSIVETVVTQRAKVLVDLCIAAGVDVNSLHGEIRKHLPATAQSGG